MKFYLEISQKKEKEKKESGTDTQNNMDKPQKNIVVS